MVANRWGLLWLVATGALTLPACAMGLRTDGPTPNKVTVPATQTTPIVKKDSFAEFPRVPGQMILKNPPTVTATTVAPTPATQTPATQTPGVAATPSEPVAKAETPAPNPIVITPNPIPDPPLVEAMRAFLNNQQDQAAERLKGMDPANKELTLQLMQSTVQASRMNLTRPTEVGTLVDQLQAPIKVLSPRAPLKIEKMLFCANSVSKFGQYKPLPDGEVFNAQDLVWLYAEIGNVPSTPVSLSGQGRASYLTELNCEIRMRPILENAADNTDPSRERVLSMVVHEPTLSPIRDHFVSFRIAVPSVPGLYKLTLEVVDPNRGRTISSRPMKFRVR